MAAFQAEEPVQFQVADVAAGPPDAIWSAIPASWVVSLFCSVYSAVQPVPPRVIPSLVTYRSSVKTAKNSAPAAAGVTEPVFPVSTAEPVPEFVAVGPPGLTPVYAMPPAVTYSAGLIVMVTV